MKIIGKLPHHLTKSNCCETKLIQKRYMIKLFGKVDGKIVSARGNLGFGWDAIFQPDCENNNKTFGEMEQCKKNKISHRYLALQKVKEYFESLD